MFMSDYDIALCDKLYDFRENFEEDNIYCYWIILTLINEIFLDQEQEVSINVKENLKNTLNILLQFYELRQERTIVDWTQQIDLNNKKEILIIINNIYDLVMNDENYKDIKQNQILNFFDNIVKEIDTIVNQKDVELPFESQSEWEDEINHALNKESAPIAENIDVREDAFIMQKNPDFLKEYIYRTSLLQYKCANCGLEEWQNEPIGLILDYKDGNPRNQQLENLQFLCPNCYSQIGKNFK